MLSPSPFSTNNVGRVHPEFFFSEFRYCEVWQEGERQENFEKDALFNKGTQRLQKIVITALLSPRTLVQDCQPLRRFLLGRPFFNFSGSIANFRKVQSASPRPGNVLCLVYVFNHSFQPTTLGRIARRAKRMSAWEARLLIAIYIFKKRSR